MVVRSWKSTAKGEIAVSPVDGGRGHSIAHLSAPSETYYRGRPGWELLINLESAHIGSDAPETDNCSCLLHTPALMAPCVYNRKMLRRKSNRGEEEGGSKRKKGGWQKILSCSLQLTSKLLYKDSPRRCIFMPPAWSPASLLISSSLISRSPLFLFHTYPSLQSSLLSSSASPLFLCHKCMSLKAAFLSK